MNKLPFGISVSEQYIFLKKRVWSDFEREIVDCNYPNIIMSEGCIRIDISSVHREAAREVIKATFPTMARRKDFDMNALADCLKETYDTHINREYEKISSHRLFEILFTHQKETIPYFIHNKYNLVAFQQGLMKTLTAIFVNDYLNLRSIVVCPAIAKYNTWLNELKKWGISMENVSVLDTRESFFALKEEKFIIINYDILERYFDFLADKRANHLILDECHYIKNTDSKRFKHIQALVTKTDPKITFLSGTPIKNRVNDMFAYLKLTHNPLGSSYAGFKDRFCNVVESRYGDSVSSGKNLDQFSVLCSPFVTRKRKEDCLDLPAKIHMKYTFELGEYQEAYLEALAAFCKMKGSTADQVESALHRVLIITTKAKMKGMLMLAEEIADNDEKVILFTSYTEPIHAMKRQLKDEAVLIDGSVPAIKRNEIIKQFENNPKIKYLLANYGAAGISVNLQFCSNTIHCNYPLTYAELEQAQDRTDRYGQKNHPNYYHTIAEGSIDEDIYGLVESKRVEAERVLDRKVSNIEYQEFGSSMVTELLKRVLGSVPQAA